jgi:hypothetical protein
MTERIHVNRPKQRPEGDQRDPSRPSRLTSTEDALIACQQAILLTLNAVMQTDPEAIRPWEQMAARVQDLENQLAALKASGSDTNSQVAQLDHMLCNIRQMGVGLHL